MTPMTSRSRAKQKGAHRRLGNLMNPGSLSQTSPARRNKKTSQVADDQSSTAPKEKVEKRRKKTRPHLSRGAGSRR